MTWRTNRTFHSHGDDLLEYLVWYVLASRQESWFKAFSLVNTVTILNVYSHGTTSLIHRPPPRYLLLAIQK